MQNISSCGVDAHTVLQEQTAESGAHIETLTQQTPQTVQQDVKYQPSEEAVLSVGSHDNESLHVMYKIKIFGYSEI